GPESISIMAPPFLAAPEAAYNYFRAMSQLKHARLFMGLLPRLDIRGSNMHPKQTTFSNTPTD
ncbi:MAG: hypothetical protein ACFFD9_11145, partial [Candidatus Thorarchaeota archaeon]